MKRLASVILLVVTIPYAVSGIAADIPFSFSDPAEEQRYKELVAELRCLVCQNQSLADSNAGLAQDLREEVYRMMQQGTSNDEIISFLVARYGDFVLYRPPMKPTTYVLWFGPLLLLILGIVVMVRFVRGRRPVSAGTTLTQDERQRVAQLLQDDKTSKANRQ